ncbi:Spo0B domain-containing protein [Metabacillus sp. FJAT-52054]|uniref:Spo0B domain-containing protein n=1 Tax=Metabacillus sediminis TaxID=3117746 RepID=A0ABZ2NJQ9_9BACI
MNPAAEEMLGSENRDHWFPKLEHLRQSGGARNAEMSYRDRVLIVNHDIILEKGKAAGMVWTFKDKTEFVKMIDTLSEVKKYSEDLRAQTHEYTNKLYVISGLLELGRTDAALDLINDESVKSQNQNQVLFEQIKDSKLQAILLGKIGKASEKKISFTIDRESSFNKGRSKRLWAFKCKSSGRGAWRMH